MKEKQLGIVIVSENIRKKTQFILKNTVTHKKELDARISD